MRFADKRSDFAGGLSALGARSIGWSAADAATSSSNGVDNMLPRRLNMSTLSRFPESESWMRSGEGDGCAARAVDVKRNASASPSCAASWSRRSEEHTSELQSLRHLVCRHLI